MRKYSVTDYLEKQKQYFEFLITDFNFKLTVEEETDFDFITEYQKKGIRVHLDYGLPLIIAFLGHKLKTIVIAVSNLKLKAGLFQC